MDFDSINNHILPPPDSHTLFGRPEEFASLPAEHHDQIHFLDKAAAQFLYNYLDHAQLIPGPLYAPFTAQNYRTYRTWENTEDWPVMKKTLFQLGIPFFQKVFLLPNYAVGPMWLTWKMVVKYCDWLFAGSDDIVVFDRSSQWCLFYYHEGTFHFGEGHLPDPEPGYEQAAAYNTRKAQHPQFRHPWLEEN